MGTSEDPSLSGFKMTNNLSNLLPMHFHCATTSACKVAQSTTEDVTLRQNKPAFLLSYLTPFTQRFKFGLNLLSTSHLIL